MLLYVGATIFVLYMTIENPDTEVWNGLFWIIQLFISINAVAKSFFAGKQEQDVILPDHHESKKFHPGKIVIQYSFDGDHEYAEFWFV